MESKKPLVSMILGIASIVCACWGPGLPLAIAALVVGNIAKNEGWENNQAKIGRILGIVGIVLSVIACVGGFFFGFFGELFSEMASYSY